MEYLKMDIPVSGKKGSFINVEVNYRLGGYNYFNGQNNPRGIYVSATPVKKEEHFDATGKVLFHSTSYELFGNSGKCKVLETLARKADKAGQRWALVVKANLAAYIKELVPAYELVGDNVIVNN